MRVTFTIFIPTYNRAYVLPKTLESVAQQTLRDFEVLILDDGSTDETRSIVEDWKEKTGIPTRYFWQENQGQQRSWNRALDLAHGELFAYLDSDNTMSHNCLERVLHHWNAIPEDKRQEFAGVEGLFAHERDGSLEGGKFPEDVTDMTYVEMRCKYGIRGDKGGALATDVARKFPYPVVEGERHLRPSTIWKRMALAGYKIRYINEVTQTIDRQPDGKTANRFRLRMRNPKGFRLYYLEDLNHHSDSLTPEMKRRSAIEYVHYSLHSRVGYVRQWRDIDHKALWLFAVPRGTSRWLVDRIRLLWRDIG